ncbi:hypothetical protein E4U31_007960 [Claviceps sp. LM219 group G6]|nr:hypothetical protein E4U31_007960 [Claviceps sp. LM219 group G6]
MAAAVQPLDTATEANKILSLESNLQDAVLDIGTPEWAGPEARDDDTDEAEVLTKRTTFTKNIPIPQGTTAASPAPVELDGVRVDFLMARRMVRQGWRMVRKPYCKSVRITNQGVKRRVSGMEVGTASRRASGKPFFEKIMSHNEAYEVKVGPNWVLFQLTVADA